MPDSRSVPALRWLPIAVLVAGSLLRVLYTWHTDPRIVHDDHFAVTKLMLNEGRWPRPDEGWQTYQPPLYHALAAVVYRVAAGDVPPAEQLLANAQHRAGRKAVQFISTAAGIGALALVALTLRLLMPGRWGLQSAAMAFAAFLPAHVYMSAMATNDSLAYFWASLTIHAALRGVIQNSKFKIQKGWWVTAGVAAALTMWTKHYGLGSLVLLAAIVPLSFTLAANGNDGGMGFPSMSSRAGCPCHETRRRVMRGGALAAGLALALGAWPYLRTWKMTGNPLASNYTLRPHTMGDQWPGELSRVSFISLRLGKLLERPWQHLDVVDSFWTQLYAKCWFDHDTTMTLFQSRRWIEAMMPIRRDRTIDGRERERRQLLWPLEVAPPVLLWQGRLLIALGAMPTALVVVGVVALLVLPRPAGASSEGAVSDREKDALFPVPCSLLKVPTSSGFPVRAMLLVALAMGLAAPLFQTLRQPFHSSMKAAFVLSALIPLAAFLAEGCRAVLAMFRLSAFGFRLWFLRRVVISVFIALMAAQAAVATWHFLYLSYAWPRSTDYVGRLMPAF